MLTPPNKLAVRPMSGVHGAHLWSASSPVFPILAAQRGDAEYLRPRPELAHLGNISEN